MRSNLSNLCKVRSNLSNMSSYHICQNIQLLLLVGKEFQDSISLPFIGFFSPFPHGTCSLSVISKDLEKEGGPPSSTKIGF